MYSTEYALRRPLGAAIVQGRQTAAPEPEEPDRWLPPVEPDASIERARADGDEQAEALAGARLEGRMWGRAHNHNPWTMAATECVRVHIVGAAEIERHAIRPCDGERTAGILRQNFDEDSRAHPVIYLNQALPQQEMGLTLCHELAHVHHPHWSDAMCEAWAQAFIAVRG